MVCELYMLLVIPLQPLNGDFEPAVTVLGVGGGGWVGKQAITLARET